MEPKLKLQVCNVQLSTQKPERMGDDYGLQKSVRDLFLPVLNPSWAIIKPR